MITKRQQEIIKLLSEGKLAKEVAEALDLSTRSVEGSIARIKENYEADTLFQLGWILREELKGAY